MMKEVGDGVSKSQYHSMGLMRQQKSRETGTLGKPERERLAVRHKAPQQSDEQGEGSTAV